MNSLEAEMRRNPYCPFQNPFTMCGTRFVSLEWENQIIQLPAGRNWFVYVKFRPTKTALYPTMGPQAHPGKCSFLWAPCFVDLLSKTCFRTTPNWPKKWTVKNCRSNTYSNNYCGRVKMLCGILKLPNARSGKWWHFGQGPKFSRLLGFVFI